MKIHENSWISFVDSVARTTVVNHLAWLTVSSLHVMIFMCLLVSRPITKADSKQTGQEGSVRLLIVFLNKKKKSLFFI